MTTATGAPVQNDVAEFDVAALRKDFPVLSREIHGQPLVYLDNAATTQKPQVVIDALTRFYSEYNANIHRGVHRLSVEATEAHDQARARVAAFLNAGDPKQIIFTRSATEALNLVAQSFARPRLKAGDEILISTLEHHANIVPWQLVCEQTGAVLRVMPITDSGEIDLDAALALFSERTRILAIQQVSNALGTINPVVPLIAKARACGAAVVVDGAQSVPHMAVDLKALDCDFFAFSGHKMFAPTGTGALYGKAELLEAMPPYQGGGDMIAKVTFEKTTYNELPYKFEAGTPDIGGAIALAAACDYLTKLGLARVAAYEQALLAYATARLNELDGVRIYGTAAEKAAVLSFNIEGVHAHDVGTILDQQGVAIRAGHHCAQPLMDRFGIPGTARASLAFYNLKEEVDALMRGIQRVIEIFR